MRRLVLLSLLLLLSVAFQPIRAQEVASVLQIVDTDPLSGQELGLEEPVSLYFDRNLDCESASAVLTIEPPIAGEVSCEGSVLTFSPTLAYERATSYQLKVDTALRGIDGAQLLEPFAFDAATPGFVNVSEVFPSSDAVDVRVDSAITVIFNRPVVPLLITEDSADLPDPLQLVPPVSGQGEWLNTSIYVFTPDTGLAGGTEYRALIDSGLIAVDGSILPVPYGWTFRTQAPTVTEILPEPQSGNVLLDQVLQITFNQPMDTESTEAAFSLQTADASAPPISGTFEWNEDNSGFRFTPDALLTIDTLYEVRLGAGALASGGGASLSGPDRWNFATQPLPAIISTSPSDGETGVYPYGGFVLNFASTMDFETLPDKISISPEPYQEPDFYYREWDEGYSVSFPTEPSTRYTITIAPGMADIYGNTIDQPFSFSYETDAYEPSLQLSVPGPVGFYNSERRPTQLFLTHRNISEIDLSLYSVATQGFIAEISNSESYDPAHNFVAQSDRLLRNWTIPSVAPENAMRYELLNLGQNSQGSALNCPAALPTRLQPGDIAVVTSDPDPVRARSEAPSGEILDLLYRDYVLPVVGGPQCTNGEILWWEVELRDGRRAWVAESVEGEYLIDVRVPSQTSAVDLEVADGDGGLRPGVYFLEAQAPEVASNAYVPSRHLMVVSSAALTVKASLDSLVVWATDVQTGAPIAAAPIQIYDDSASVIASGMTDANGLLQLDVPPVTDLYQRRTAVLETDTYFGIGSTEWSNGIDPWQFGQEYDFYPSPYRLYVYTDRPVYRPGQPVYFRGILREKDDVSYSLSRDIQTLDIIVYDGRGESVYSESVPLSAYGSFTGTLPLAEDAPLGSYYMDITVPGQDEFIRGGGGISFSVAAYRLPEYQVMLETDSPEVTQGDTISLALESRYFFGGAVSNAEVSYNVITEPYYLEYTGPGNYSFFDFDADGGPASFFSTGSNQIASGSGQTDDQGRYQIDVLADLAELSQSQTFTIEALVTDESNQAVAARERITVHQSMVYAGVRPTSYVSSAGQETSFDILTVDWQSQPVADQSVEISIVERIWSSVQERDDLGRTTWTWSVEEIPVISESVVTDAQGRATYSFTPPTGGIYKAIVTTRDAEANLASAATTIWISGMEYVAWRQQNSNRIDLIADKDAYAIGETAEILITSPFQGEAQALITVERGGILTVEQVTMDTNSYVYRLPILEDYAPNVFVSAFIVKGVDENNPVAAFRMGYVQLGVAVDRKEIDIQITSNIAEARPQSTVTYTIRTSDYEGNPLQAEVGIGVTDLAALSIGLPNSTPILQYFYGQQGLGVRTASGLAINTDQLTQETLDTVKGGGGGGIGDGLIEIRGEFVDTPYWDGSVITGADGSASIDVRLPDNLTTWRLDARAVTRGDNGETLVGEATFDLISTRPLIIRPVTPRFFVVGDEVLLGAVVNNNTADDLEVTVSMAAIEGLTLLDGMDTLQQQLSIPANGRARVNWRVRVEDVASVRPIFSVQSPDNEALSDSTFANFGDSDSEGLPVYRYTAPEIVGTAGSLRSTESMVENIVLPRRFADAEGLLSIRIDESLTAVALEALDSLTLQPQQSIEYTVSSFLPNILTYRALNFLGIADPELETELTIMSSLALQKLTAEQKPDGGWGWFVQDDSDPLVTAYALIGLAEARQQGFAVSIDMISRAQSFLQSRFITLNANRSRAELNRQAFLLYALARTGAPDVARSTNLYDNRQGLSLYAKGLLAQTLYYINPDDTGRTNVLVDDLIASAITSATGIHWEETERDYINWNTDTRSNAIILDTLLQLRPQSELLPNVVRYLMAQRSADFWETPQETAWVVMALTDWMIITDELRPDYNYSISLKGNLLLEDTASADTPRMSRILEVDIDNLDRSQPNTLALRRTGTTRGSLYYSAHLEVQLPVAEVEPLNRGLIVSRRYVLPDDPTQAIDQAQVGDVVQVRLTIIAPNDLHYVFIEDPLPGGAEAIDPNLVTSQQLGTRPGLDSSDPLSRGWGWWWFSKIDFLDEKVVLYSTYLPAGTYEYVYSMRLGVEGTYQVIPANGREYYFPEVSGRSAGAMFTVLPAETEQ